MNTSTSFKRLLAAAACAALTFGVGSPALAHGKPVETTRTAPRHYAAPARTYAAPRHYAAPARTYAAPRHYAAQTRTYAAPRHYAAQTRTYAAPRHYAAPARTYAAPRHYAAQARTYAAPRHYAAPARTYAAPRHYAVRARRNVETRRYAAPRGYAPPARAYFANRTYARTPKHFYARTVAAPAVQRTEAWTSRSPLIRAVYAHRAPVRVAYHPAYLSGRVISVRNGIALLQPPSGSAIPIDCRCATQRDFDDRFRVGTYQTVPVVYTNGTYAEYTYYPQYDAYYPQYGTYYANAPYYANAQSYYYANAPYYDSGVPYDYSNVYFGSSPDYGYTQGSPYDNCLNTDDDGDEAGNFCAAQPTNYYGQNSYGYNSGLALPLQQLQGLVVAKSGSMLMVLGTNGQPMFVDASPATQTGYAINGPVSVGQVIDAFGYYNGNTFVATALE